MERQNHFTDPNAIEARIALDLPGTVSPGELPKEIQWAPPGRHTINASRGGKPVELTVNVTPGGAERVAEMHAKYMAAAMKDEGDRPYLDHNHEDREASAHPTAFRWGGDDPQRGGIRAEVEWTGAGRRAVLGREYRRFSPSFYVDDKGEISGAPVNMGGLVNRAAFQRIAPVMSKLAATDAIAAAPDFVSKAKILARARNLDLETACTVLAREDHGSYESYRYYELGLGEEPKPAKENSYAAKYREALNDELFIRARSLSDAMDIGLVEAIVQIARKQPAIYERYREKLGLGNGRDYAERVQAVHARAEESEFFALSKRIAAEESIELADAFSIAARRSPEFYDSYRASCF